MTGSSSTSIVSGVALAFLAAADATRPVDVIEHIVVFMQENRPYDHYFGTLQGVRGFNDRAALPLKNGWNSFYQPIDDANMSAYMLPFRVDAKSTSAICMPAPEMDYACDIKILNAGRHDRWNTARDPGMGMAYFTREDLPYYYALYDGFATGDHYFQSTFTATNPNRMFLFSGSNGLSVGEPAVLDNYEPKPGYTWETMGEVLEKAGVSWRVYQQIDNFDDNAFAWFANFHNSRPGEPLFDKGMKRTVSAIETFEEDVVANKLPAVSWVIAPTHRSEHATHHPSAGEDFTARLLQVLQRNPEVYAKTAFILDYDEGGQFYDHGWAPTPPMPDSGGISTVSVDGEINSEVSTTEPAPIGMGFRVPLLVVSPWTRGNVVVSEVFDHTSVIQLIEERFNVTSSVISPWRRTVAGNMLSAFDFEHPDYSWPSNLPDTSNYVVQSIEQCRTLPPPEIPTEQNFPIQESGTRVSRALPYEFKVSDLYEAIDLSVQLTISIENSGSAGAHFMFLDVINLASVNPRQYTIEMGKHIQDKVLLQSVSGDYRAALMGPNGFVRTFEGNGADKSCVGASAWLSYDSNADAVMINIQNLNIESSMKFQVTDNAYSHAVPAEVTVLPSSTTVQRINTISSGNWYDLSIISGEASSCFKRRFMGRMETGKDTISDPAMSAGIGGIQWNAFPEVHPEVPVNLRKVSRNIFAQDGHKDSVFYNDKNDEL